MKPKAVDLLGNCATWPTSLALLIFKCAGGHNFYRNDPENMAEKETGEFQSVPIKKALEFLTTKSNKKFLLPWTEPYEQQHGKELSGTDAHAVLSLPQ